MSERDRERWEAKYRERTTAPMRPLPSLEWIAPAHAGAVALDVACGAGRHCRPLIERGYRIVAVDIAAAALRMMKVAIAFDDSLMRIQADLDAWPFARDVFDLVVQCDFLDRRLFRDLKESVRPGGCVLIDTFCGPAVDGRGPSNAEYRLEQGELARVFSSWRIERAGSAEADRDAILARKPRF